jgi:hypothetical protein
MAIENQSAARPTHDCQIGIFLILIALFLYSLKTLAGVHP